MVDYAQPNSALSTIPWDFVGETNDDLGVRARGKKNSELETKLIASLAHPYLTQTKYRKLRRRSNATTCSCLRALS